jgi:hypothetical protein
MAVADGYFDGDADFIDQATEAERDDFNSRYDDRVERYGDRCPGCGTLRWGGDCPKCFSDMHDDDVVRTRYFQDTYGEEWAAKLAEADAHVAELDARAAAERQAVAAVVVADDDIPF